MAAFKRAGLNYYLIIKSTATLVAQTQKPRFSWEKLSMLPIRQLLGRTKLFFRIDSRVRASPLSLFVI